MRRFARLLLLATLLPLAVVSCGEAPPEPTPAVPLDPHEALVSQLKAASTSPTPPASISLAPCNDSWVIARPDALPAKWSTLGIKVPPLDKERLFKEAASSPNVVVARITEGRVAEVSTLSQGLSTSPEVFTAKGGDTLTLSRPDPAKPLVIEKPKS